VQKVREFRRYRFTKKIQAPRRIKIKEILKEETKKKKEIDVL